jgi:hypothetical protein
MQRRDTESAVSGAPTRLGGGMVHTMTLATDNEVAAHEFTVEDITTGVHASGFGQVGDGRTFSFHIERHALVVEVYRPRLRGLVPQAEDIVAMSSRKLTDIDLTDERSMVAAVRDAVAGAHPVPRSGR